MAICWWTKYSPSEHHNFKFGKYGLIYIYKSQDNVMISMFMGNRMMCRHMREKPIFLGNKGHNIGGRFETIIGRENVNILLLEESLGTDGKQKHICCCLPRCHLIPTTVLTCGGQWNLGLHSDSNSWSFVKHFSRQLLINWWYHIKWNLLVLWINPSNNYVLSYYEPGIFLIVEDKLVIRQSLYIPKDHRIGKQM